MRDLREVTHPVLGFSLDNDVKLKLKSASVFGAPFAQQCNRQLLKY